MLHNLPAHPKLIALSQVPTMGSIWACFRDCAGFYRYEFPYYSPEQLVQAFFGLVTDANVFAWKGLELFWATKS